MVYYYVWAILPGNRIVRYRAKGVGKMGIKQDAKQIWNLPNILTMLRMVMVVVFAILFYRSYYIAAGVVFLLAALTDLVDGFIARKYNLITNFGKLMDPLADKLLLIVALICLVSRGFLPPFILVFVLIKEGIMVIGGAVLYNKNVVVYAKQFGKFASFFFNAGVVLTFLSSTLFPAIGEYRINLIVFVIAIILAVLAVGQYAISFWKQRNTLSKQNSSKRNLK